MIDAERFRSLLEHERITARGLVASLRAEIAAAGASRVDTHLNEGDSKGSSTIFEISQEAALLENQLEHLEDIDAALGRIVDGTYGICLECGQPIVEASLEARPWTGYCIDHASRHRPPLIRTRPGT